MIEAETLEDATVWGDHLAKRYAKGSTNENFLRSKSEPVHKLKNVDLSETPRFKYGYEATDEEIGWQSTQQAAAPDAAPPRRRARHSVFKEKIHTIVYIWEQVPLDYQSSKQ